jgi:hypothetical protein
MGGDAWVVGGLLMAGRKSHGSASEVHQENANCRGRIGARRGNAGKRNNAETEWRPLRSAGSGHGAADRHDGCTKSDADERALSKTFSATGVRPVAVPLEALGIEGGQLVSLDMSPSEYAAAPTWRDTEATPLP